MRPSFGAQFNHGARGRLDTGVRAKCQLPRAGRRPGTVPAAKRSGLRKRGRIGGVFRTMLRLGAWGEKHRRAAGGPAELVGRRQLDLSTTKSVTTGTWNRSHGSGTPVVADFVVDNSGQRTAGAASVNRPTRKRDAPHVARRTTHSSRRNSRSSDMSKRTSPRAAVVMTPCSMRRDLYTRA